MSRYPGTQFRVHDNSHATAIVPVTNANINDTIQYLTSFASVKGPEGITLTAGENFYTLYGTQDNIDFKKYGQPLLQASMNVNNGAAVLAKRAVLDDASLGNATLAVALTKYKDAKITSYIDEDNDKSYPDLIGEIKFVGNDVSVRYSIAPMMFSIDNINNYNHATRPVNEYKERYDFYKEYIQDIVANNNTPDNKFLNKLFGSEDNNILSGFSQSIYYDDNNKVIDVLTEGIANVRKVSSITTGIYDSTHRTYSSSFTTDEIVDCESSVQNNILATDEISINEGKATLWKATKVKTAEGNVIKWEKQTPTSGVVSYVEVYEKIASINRIFNFNETDEEEINNKLNNNITVNHPEWLEDDEYDIDSSNEYAVVIPGIKSAGYDTVARLLNDIMAKKSGYIICEYIFPMFTIFDNGRGESIKSIGIEYDSATSVTLKKAVYTLSIYNYKTSKRLEKFSFSLNPYARNNNTGFTFDIESAVNYVSNQVQVKTYYESYDALLETVQEILDTTDNSIIENYDILFGHELSGKYPVFNSYYVSTALRRNTYVYDYAHLDIFDNDILTINACCESDNMTSTESTMVKYYYYNFTRQQRKIIERLEMGFNGYYIGRNKTKKNSGDFIVPFIVIDDTDILGDDKNSVSMNSLIELTGQKNGTIISDISNSAIDTNGNIICGDISNAPIVESNFIRVALNLTSAKKFNNGSVDSREYYISNNNKTLSMTNVLKADEQRPDNFNGYQLTTNNKVIDVFVPLSTDYLYQEQYRRFFNGDFDRDIFNLDIYFPNALFDANYSNPTKLAIQRLVAFRGDMMCYMDMGINKINSYNDCFETIPSMSSGLELTDEESDYYYIRDMHVAVTCLSYKIRNPYDNKIIPVTATYGLSNLYINHFKNDVSKVFAGISNNITINNIIEGSVSYIPKIYPTNEMTSLSNIGGVYPSDDETIINEKQLMCDLRVNYGCYYDDRFSIETEYTMNPTDSEFSYWNNVALVCLMMQSIRKACPTARYQFITSDDLNVYKVAVETAMKPWKNKFASVKFKYVQDPTSIENKIFYAAIEVVFKPFAQAEIFELTALNYSTLSSSVTSV